MPKNNPTNMQHLIQSVKAVMHETGNWRDYPCLLWDRGLVYGYGQVSLGKSCHRVHRVAWKVAHGDIPEMMRVCHHCDIRNCFRPVHLFLGTDADNMQDMISKGRRYNVSRERPEVLPRGEGHYKATLTGEQVLEIRRLAAVGMGQTQIGRLLGIRQSQIYKIVHREIWKHI